MYFLNPEAFWALFLLFIPILIHLFNLRRVKKIYFSNIKFLKEVSQQRKSRTTLKKLLVLATRILALVFIVMAFAQPVFLTEESDGPVQNPIIYLDNSLSLQRTDNSGNLLLINGISSVVNVLNDLPKGQDVGLLTNGGKPLRWKNRDQTIEEVQQLDYSSEPTSLLTVYNRSKRLNGQHVFVFSDFQKTMTDGIAKFIEDTTRKTTFYKLNSPARKNLYVDSVYLNEPLNVSSDNKLIIKVKNTGPDKATDVLVKLYKGNTQLASFTTGIEANAEKKLTLDLSANIDKTGNYSVELEDSPVVFDNLFHFTINKAERPRITILSESSANHYLRNIYSNHDLFILSLEKMNNVSFQNIVNADLLVLDHIEHIPEWLKKQIDQFEGKILICPDTSSTVSDYSELLGVKLSKKSMKQTTLDHESLDNPFFKDVFIQRNDRMDMPSVSLDYSVSGYFESILNTISDDPFLLRRDNYYFFTSSFDQQSTFPKHALFVPVMYKLAQRENIESMYHRIGGHSITFNIDSIPPESLLELKNTQHSFIVQPRYIQDKIQLVLPDILNDPGIYYLVNQGDTLQSIALNYSWKESEIASVSTEDLHNLAAGSSHIRIQEISDVHLFTASDSNQQDPHTLWKYALFLALFFMIAEISLLRFT